MRAGWYAEGLPLVDPYDGEYLTLNEVAVILNLTPAATTRLRNGVKFTHVFPVGRRRSMIATNGEYLSGRGRLARVYHADELIELVELLALTGPRYTDSPGAGRGYRGA